MIYPNPAIGSRFFLYLWLDEDASIEAYFYAPTAEQKVSFAEAGRGGRWNTIPVDVREAVPGVYYVKVVARFVSGAPSRHFPIARLLLAGRP